MYEMMAGRSPFDTVGHADNPDQNTEDYLFQSESVLYLFSVCVCFVFFICYLCFHNMAGAMTQLTVSKGIPLINPEAKYSAICTHPFESHTSRSLNRRTITTSECHLFQVMDGRTDGDR